jgi:hypothetical protein
MKITGSILVGALFLSGCTTPPISTVTSDLTVADALAAFQNGTTIGSTTYRACVSKFGKGQDWIRGNMPNAAGVTKFCWTLIFRQTDGAVYVNFSTDDLNEPMESWTLYSITPKVGRQQSSSPDTLYENIEVNL